MLAKILFGLVLAQTSLASQECLSLQERIFEAQSKNSPAISMRMIDSAADFRKFKPVIDDDNTIAMAGYIPKQEERTARYQEIWCKGKGRVALEDRFLWPKSNTKSSYCGQLQQDMIEQVVRDQGIQFPRYIVKPRTYRSGIEWLNNARLNLKTQPLIQWDQDGTLKVQPQVLQSSQWPDKIPVDSIKRIAGQYYCKVLSRDGVQALAHDLAQKQYQWVGPSFRLDSDLAKLSAIPGVDAGRFSWRSKNILSRSHYYVAHEESLKNIPKGIMVISPGGAIPPIAMRGLALSFAKKGYLSLVLSYPGNLAIFELESSVRSLALAVNNHRVQAIAGYLSLLPQDLPLFAFGHSLGGAVLGRVVFSDDNPFDHIAIYGAASFFGADPDSLGQKPVTLLFGGQERAGEGIVSSQLKTLKGLFGVELQDDGRYWNGSQVWVEELPFLNHFGILSDAYVGDDTLRSRDGNASDVRESVEVLIKKVDYYIHSPR